MKTILCLETSGVNCSVALFQEGNLVAYKEENTGTFSHSEKLHLFIQEVLGKISLTETPISAVCVSAGPGSYTGLRIGVSSAKGLCFAWGVPLIALPTLEVLLMPLSEEVSYYIPMIDARRMEVYTAVFDAQKQYISPPEAKILTEESFLSFLEQGKVVFLGDGASKFAEICKHKNALFLKDIYPSACVMGKASLEKYNQKQWEDIAYYEPFYLKSGIMQ